MLRTRRLASVACGCAFVATAATPVSAAPKLIAIDDLPGATFTHGRGISADGSTVVGVYQTASTTGVYYWTALTGMVSIGTNPSSTAWAASGDGSVIVGQGLPGGADAFRWTSATGAINLSAGFGVGLAREVSADGSVVVGRIGGSNAFRWTQATGTVLFGSGDPFDVSNDGNIIAGRYNSPSGQEAFRWTQATGIVGLGDLPGGAFNSQATGISADGTVIVGSGTSASGREAIRYTVSGGMVPLGDLPGGSFLSEANAVSDDGNVVVGLGTGAGASDAFYWTPTGGMQDLWDVLLAAGVNPALDGWESFNVANHVSADGTRIIGGGTRNGMSTAFLAIVPRPAAYYWDINGVTPGAGGTGPAGNWDGVATHFNTDPIGGGAGTLSAAPDATDTAVFAAGNEATGSYTVNVSGTRSAAQVNVEEGNVTFTGGTLAVPAFDVSAGATGTVASNIAAPANSLTKSGAGTLQVTKLPTNHDVDITAGTVRVLHSAPAGPGTNPERGNDANVSQVTSLTIAAGATLDLTNNDLILDYTGASPATQIEALVASGYNVTGDWAGDGITSSVAALDGSYVLAVADNADLAAPFGSAQGGPLFSGVDVDLDTILIKFTHRVDINLDGVITPDDASIFGTNYDESITSGFTFAMGDVDFDGACTPNDAAIFGTFYDESLASLPEPACAALLAMAGLGLIRRRR